MAHSDIMILTFKIQPENTKIQLKLYKLWEIKEISYTYFIHRETNETKKIRQNPEKWDYNHFQWILMAEFHLYWIKLRITLLF